MVAVWKGAAKPLGLAAMARTAFAGFLHYIRIGRNEVTEEDERRAAADAAGERLAEPRDE